MTSSWTLTSRLLQVLARHLRGYIHVASADAALLTIDLRHRLLASLLAMVSGTLCLLLGLGWIVASVWNTPWRLPVLAAMLVLLAAGAVIGALWAARPYRAGQQPFAGMRREFDTDTTLINDLSSEDRLRQSRGEVAGLFRQAGAGSAGSFPRSMVMRMLLSVTGLGAAPPR